MENIRADLMAEVQKCAKLNQEQIAMCHQPRPPASLTHLSTPRT